MGHTYALNCTGAPLWIQLSVMAFFVYQARGDLLMSSAPACGPSRSFGVSRDLRGMPRATPRTPLFSVLVNVARVPRVPHAVAELTTRG